MNLPPRPPASSAAAVSTATSASAASSARAKHNGMNQQEQAVLAKSFLEQKYQSMRADRDEVEKRRLQLEDQLQHLPSEVQHQYRQEFRRSEMLLQRAARKRLSVDTDFVLLKIIGKGAFGQVRLVKKKDTGEIFAMKTMVKEAMVLKNQVTHVRAERNILASRLIDTTYLVELENSFQDRHNLYLLMEFLPGGDLMGLLMKENVLTEPACKFYIAETLLAIEAVHEMGYIHRDLKPDNLLLDFRGHIKLTDLGLCKKVETTTSCRHSPSSPPSSSMPLSPLSSASSSPAPPPPLPNTTRYVRDRKQAYSTVGTPDYISVEVLSQNGYGMGCDWWSMGVILFECMFGYPPFYSDDPMQTCRRILNWKQSLKFPSPQTVSDDAMDFCQRLICDPDTRLGARGGSQELKAAKWFTNVDFATLRQMDAPFVPKFSLPAKDILRELQTRTPTDPRFRELIEEITCNFDQFPDEPLPGVGHLGKPTLGSWSDPKFLGFTFNNTKKSVPAAMVVVRKD
ncbi:hypothetical protein BASA81_010139 [Batrachochytrium salamandrivorans]|nr:hypothetical protein BASA81_010139 [Batrachochytrium salamandrivorans]